MKQSQNAITFLRSQYEAIYGRAYVKGLASVMVMTSAIVGSYTHDAQAATEKISGGTSWDDAKDVGQDVDSGILPLDNGYYNNVTIKSGVNFGIHDINLKGELSIEAGGSASLSKYPTISGTIYGWDNLNGQTSADAVGSFNSQGSFGIGSDGYTNQDASAQAHFKNIALESGSETGIRGSTNVAQAIKDYTQLAGGYNSGAIEAKSGSMVHLKNNAQLFVAQGSTGVFNGQINLLANTSGTNSFIRGEDGYVTDANGSGSWNGSGSAAKLVFGESSYLKVADMAES